MGKATRWLKALFTFKTENIRETPYAGMCHDPLTIPPNLSPIEAAWLRSYHIETEKEQSKHAIAVAAATAAAADAAIVAAHAAAAVVKLTINGRGKAEILQSCRERYAAVRIQSVFRGYLARKALRALRSLVKIQAVVRGFLVRKQAVETLKSMQALVRAQSAVRSRRGTRFSGEFVSRNSLDNIEIRSSAQSRRFSSPLEPLVDDRAKLVEIDTSARHKARSRSRSRRCNLSISECQAHYCSRHLSPYVHGLDWALNEDECKFSTARSTPKLLNKSFNNPSYMANTQSFMAKVRSHSAPRQRLSDGLMRRRVSLPEMKEARNSMSHASVSFKNVVMGKIDGSRDGYYNNGIRR